MASPSRPRHTSRACFTITSPDKSGRPDVALVRDALVLRREAEEAAWVFMANSTEYPYSEEVYPWVRARIESGDRNRQLGQDLLFGTDPKMWSTAAEKFAAARKDYADARADGSKVAAALAARDRVFARLPYYARWLAAYRGNRQPAEVEGLIGHAESAFRGAHHLAELTGMDVPQVDKLAELDKIRADADRDFRAVTDAFDGDVARLTTEPLPSNWHALDNALTVPFIPAQRRGELLGFLRHVSYQLEANRQQPDGSQVAPPRMREIAARSGRLALALLGATSPDRPQLLPGVDPAALRTAGDQIGERFRALAKDARGQSDRSTRAVVARGNRGPGRGREARPPGRPGRAAPEPGPRRRSSAAAAALVPPLASAAHDNRGLGQRRFHQHPITAGEPG